MREFTGTTMVGERPGAVLDDPRRLSHVHVGKLLLISSIGGRGSSPALPLHDDAPYTVLVHVGTNGSSRSRLITSSTAAGPIEIPPGDLQAVAVPDRLLPVHADPAPRADLPQTPLVRASRAIVAVLLTSDALREPDPATEDVLVALVRAVLGQQSAAAGPSTPVDPLGERVHALIAARHRDPSFDVDTIARELCFSRRQLYRRASGDAGVAAQIARQRLSTAMRLIGEDPSLTLSDVAARSGFPGAANMRALFTGRLGVTPSMYRRRIRASRRG